MPNAHAALYSTQEENCMYYCTVPLTGLQVPVDDVQLVAVGNCAHDLQEVVSRLVLVESARVLHDCDENEHTAVIKFSAQSNNSLSSLYLN